jgi:hypothetical protein
LYFTASSRNSQQCFFDNSLLDPVLHQPYPHFNKRHFHIIPVNFSLFIARFHNQNSVRISRFRDSLLTSRIYGSENKNRLFPYKELTDWGVFKRRRVFTARYELLLYIYFRLIFVLKGFICLVLDKRQPATKVLL